MSVILGIESSCDETAAAVVVNGFDVRSSVVSSQHDLHAEYGGVVPEIASRAHVERILPVVRRALADAGVAYGDLDAVAVGHRPGLIGSLLVGLAGAKALAWSLGVPLIGVDHVHAHLYAGFLGEPEAIGSSFPAIGLVVSGGHTAIYRLEDPLAVVRMGTTIDDAIGEAYDKVASILGLGHPGGPLLDRLAQNGDPRAFEFPISRLGRDSLDFSFSGLKTSVLYTVRGTPDAPDRPGSGTPPLDLSETVVPNIAASFQRAAVGAVMLKLVRAIAAFPAQPRSLLVGGGVSANSFLRSELLRFGAERNLLVKLPRMAFCIDNAAMIAGLAHHRWVIGDADDLSLAAVPTTMCADSL